MIFSIQVLLVSLAIGRLLLKTFFKWNGPILETTSLGFGIGIGTVSLLLYFLGLVGFFDEQNLSFLFWLFTGISVIVLAVNFRGGLIKINFKSLSIGEKALLAYCAVLLLLSLISCFLPPTSGDALCYHLNIPKRWVQEGRIIHLPYLNNSLFPLLIQILYGASYAMKQDYAAQIIHWLCGAGATLGLYCAGVRWFARETGLWAAAIFLSVPGIFGQMQLPLNDIAVVFFIFWMVYVLLVACETQSVRLFILAGLFAGFALGIKYPAAIAIFAALVAAFFVIQKPWGVRQRLFACCVFGATAAIIGGYWYFRSYYLEQNPFYPLFADFFGTVEFPYSFTEKGYGKSLFDLLLAPFRMTLVPDKFGASWNQIGIFYLAALPLYFVRQNRPALFFKIYCVCFFLGWFFLVQNLRFSWMMLPFLTLLGVGAGKPFFKLFTVILLIHFAINVNNFAEKWLHVIRKQDIRAELKDQPYYQLSGWVNSVIPAKEKVLVEDEISLYYFDPNPIRANAWRVRHRGIRPEDLKKEDVRWVVCPKIKAQLYPGYAPASEAKIVNTDWIILKNEI